MHSEGWPRESISPMQGALMALWKRGAAGQEKYYSSSLCSVSLSVGQSDLRVAFQATAPKPENSSVTERGGKVSRNFVSASRMFIRAACLQNETAPEKLLNRYEKRFEKCEKGSEKRSETRLKIF